MRIAGLRFEAKTASMGAKRTFQFNHVRLSLAYEYLLCLGICPNEIVFNMCRQTRAVAERQSRVSGTYGSRARR